MWGLGSVTRARLAESGVHTIGLLAKMPECSLEDLLAASTAVSPIRTAERDRGWLGRAMRVESARSGSIGGRQWAIAENTAGRILEEHRAAAVGPVVPEDRKLQYQ